MHSCHIRVWSVFLRLSALIVLALSAIPHVANAVIAAPSSPAVVPTATEPIPSPQGLEHLSSIGGAFHSIAVSGTRAYVGEGDYFKVLDVSDHGNIRELGRLRLGATEIQLTGDYAVVRSSGTTINSYGTRVATGGITIVDVRDLAHPLRVASYDENVEAFQVAGNQLVVAGTSVDRYGEPTNGFLRVLDISNPAVLSLRGSFTTLPGVVHALAVSGTRAYVSYEAWRFSPSGTPSAGVAILDLQPPTPVLMSTFDVTDFANDGRTRLKLAVQATVLYVVSPGYEGNELLSVDVSTPASPHLIDTYPLDSDIRAIRVIGAHLYVTLRFYIGTSRDGFYYPFVWIYDLADPAHPRLSTATEFKLAAYANDISVEAGIAYLAEDTGIQVIDVRNLGGPQQVGAYEGLEYPQYPRSLAAANDHVYIADDTSLKVINVANPTSPTLQASYTTAGGARDVDLVGTTAYVAGYGVYSPTLQRYQQALEIVDVANPATPHRVGIYAAERPSSHVRVGSGLAYLGLMGSAKSEEEPDFGAGLEIVDVHNPNAVTHLSTYSLATSPSALEIAGNVAVVAISGIYSSTLGTYVGAMVEVVDVTDPTRPVLASRIAGRYYDLQLVGNLLYLMTGSSLRILDIANPASPLIRGELIFSGDTAGLGSGGIHVVGTRAYVGGGNFGVVDVSNPASPSLIGAMPGLTPISVDMVRTMNSYAYVINDYDQRMRVIDISSPQSMHTISLYRTVGSVRFSKAIGNRIYTAGLYNISSIDISDPANPRLISFRSVSPSPIYDADFSAEYIVVATGYYLEIYDARDQIRLLKLMLPYQGYVDVKIVGSYVYASTGESNSNTWTIVNLATRREVGGFAAASFKAADAELSGNHLFLPDGEIFDVSDPASPTLLGKLGSASSSNVRVFGNRAYITGVSEDSGGPPNYDELLIGRLDIYDVSNPAAPNFLGSYNGCVANYTVSRSERGAEMNVVQATGNSVYLDTACAGLQLIDVSSPTNPRLQATIGGHADYITGNIAINADDSLQFYRPRPDTFQTSTPIPTSGGTLTSNDGNVRVVFPSGSVTSTVDVTLTPIREPEHPPPADSMLVRSFAINARTASGAAITHFSPPLTVEVSYSEAEMAAHGLSESSLNLVYWNGAQWVSVLPCTDCRVDTEANKVIVQLNHLTEFALIRTEQRKLLLPLVLR